MQRERIVFVGGVPPDWGTQSGPVLFRHLTRLARDFEVVCVHYSGTAPANYPLKTLRIPARRAFWPPHREAIPGSRALRDRLVCNFLAKTLDLRASDKILTYVCSHEHVMGRHLASKVGAKLHCIVHDLWPDSALPEVTQTLRRADHVFTVSETLLQAAMGLGAAKGSVLLPIGEDFLDMPGRPPEGSLTVGIAGSLGDDYVELGSRLSDNLIVIGSGANVATGGLSVRVVPRFPVNRDALRYLAANCHALLVKMPEDAACPYNAFAFPSRLIDFSQTGLPLILCAPRASNLGRWALRHEWRCWLESRDDAEAIRSIRAYLLDAANWRKECDRTAAIARGEFSPDRIHNELSAVLAA